jgi:hypothetical protein
VDIVGSLGNELESRSARAIVVSKFSSLSHSNKLAGRPAWRSQLPVLSPHHARNGNQFSEAPGGA